MSDTKFGYNATSLFKKDTRIAKKRPNILLTDRIAGFKTDSKRQYLANPNPVHHTLQMLEYEINTHQTTFTSVSMEGFEIR